MPKTNAAGKRALARIRKIRSFVEGSFTITQSRCGKPKCRCQKEGPIHEVALLTWKEKQKTHTLYVPRALRKQVAEWVQEARRLKELMHEMSEAQRRFLIQLKKDLKQ